MTTCTDCIYGSNSLNLQIRLSCSTDVISQCPDTDYADTLFVDSIDIQRESNGEIDIFNAQYRALKVSWFHFALTFVSCVISDGDEPFFGKKFCVKPRSLFDLSPRMYYYDGSAFALSYSF